MIKPELKRPKLELNLEKECIIIESVIAGLSGKKGIIKSVHGNDIDGYRYEVILPEPLYTFTDGKLNYFPPAFLCDVLN